MVNYTIDGNLIILDEPVEYEPGRKTQYFIVSCANAFFTGPEIKIFPADEKGEILSWIDVVGCRDCSWAEALYYFDEWLKGQEESNH